jgi:Flp pilus assembly protein TadD
MKYFLILLLYFSFGVDYVTANSPRFAEYQSSKQSDAFQRGLAALKENRPEDALVEFTAAEREYPDNARVRSFRGILLARMGKNAEAAAEYQEAIRLDPFLEDACRNLGFLRWTEHQLESAREMLQQAVKLSPDDWFAHYYLGRVDLDAQRYEQAFFELELSRQPLPSDAGFLIQAATGYIELGRVENARQSLEQLTNLPLSDAQSLQVASLLLSIHENDRAINVMQKLNKRQSTAQSTWAQFDLALAYLLAGNYDRAAEQALVYARGMGPEGAQSPEGAQAWSLIGIAYAHLNQGEQSINALRQAAAFAPGEEEYLLNLTRELMELNRYREAVTAVQSGLATNPRSYAVHLR